MSTTSGVPLQVFNAQGYTHIDLASFMLMLANKNALQGDRINSGTMLMNTVHNACRDRGWWSDKNGVVIDRDRLHLMALIWSEVVEAYDGLHNFSHINEEKRDEYLPHFPAAVVEMQDSLIRLFDMAGAYYPELPRAIILAQENLHYEEEELRKGATTGFAWLMVPWGAAVEHIRKNRHDEACKELGSYVARTMILFDMMGLRKQAAEAFQAKFRYNMTRADHAPAARFAEGGKEH